MKIDPVNPINKTNRLNFEYVYKILSANYVTPAEKKKFISENRSEIKHIMNDVINDIDFKFLMDKRPLQKFRPLKNSYTKWGDKLILAKALNIPISQVPKYIANAKETMENLNDLDCLPKSTFEMLKSYVYRHGTKDELVVFLDYELKKAHNIEKCLYNTLSYYSGGVADYFIRPIHRLDNKTLLKMYHVINENIKLAQKTGSLSKEHSNKLAKIALVRIYEIQNNSKLLNAIKTYNTLK